MSDCGKRIFRRLPPTNTELTRNERTSTERTSVELPINDPRFEKHPVLTVTESAPLERCRRTRPRRRKNVGTFLFRNWNESLNDPGIELRSAVFYQPPNRLFVRQPGPVASIRDHRVIRIDHADDSRNQRNIGSLQSRGIAAAVHGFVMMKGVKTRFFKTRKESQYRPAVLRMTIDKRALIRSERSVLFQNRIRHANLANVV